MNKKIKTKHKDFLKKSLYNNKNKVKLSGKKTQKLIYKNISKDILNF